MNDKQRKDLSQLSNELSAIRSKVEDIQQENQDAYDNMPESFRDGEKGESAQACIDNLQTTLDGIDQAQEGMDAAQQD